MKAIACSVILAALAACAQTTTTSAVDSPPAPATAAVTAPVGVWVRIPDTVANFVGRARRNFEDPRDGTGLRYEHPATGLFADIFVYPGPDLASKCALACAKDVLAREVSVFRETIAERMIRNGFAQAAKVTSSAPITPPSDARWQLGHHVGLEITRQDRAQRSEYYVFYLPGYRVKFRSTFVDTPARSEALDAFLKAVLQGLPGGS